MSSGVGWAEEAIGMREQSNCLAASKASQAVQDWALRSAVQHGPTSSYLIIT